jgi:hypothetical protein
VEEEDGSVEEIGMVFWIGWERRGGGIWGRAVSWVEDKVKGPVCDKTSGRVPIFCGALVLGRMCLLGPLRLGGRGRVGLMGMEFRGG